MSDASMDAVESTGAEPHQPPPRSSPAAAAHSEVTRHTETGKHEADVPPPEAGSNHGGEDSSRSSGRAEQPTESQAAADAEPSAEPAQQPATQDHGQDSAFTASSHRPFEGIELYHHHPSKTSPTGIPTGTLASSLRASLTRSYSQIYNIRKSQELPSNLFNPVDGPGQDTEPAVVAASFTNTAQLDQLLQAPIADSDLRMVTPPPMVLSDEALQKLEERESALEAELAAQAAETEEKIAHEVDDMGKALDRALDKALQEMQDLPDVPASSFGGDSTTGAPEPGPEPQVQGLPEVQQEAVAAHTDQMPTDTEVPGSQIEQGEEQAQPSIANVESDEVPHPVMLDLPRVDSTELMQHAAALDSPIENFQRLTPKISIRDRVVVAEDAASSSVPSGDAALQTVVPGAAMDGQADDVAGSNAGDADVLQLQEEDYQPFVSGFGAAGTEASLPATPLLGLAHVTPVDEPGIQAAVDDHTEAPEAGVAPTQAAAELQQLIDALDDMDASVLEREGTFSFDEEQQARSKAIAEQLAKLQEESRRLQEQSRALQERATAIQREALLTGVPVPAGWLAANANVGLLAAAPGQVDHKPIVSSPKKQPRAPPPAPVKQQETPPAAATAAPPPPPVANPQPIQYGVNLTQPKLSTQQAPLTYPKPSLNWGLPQKKLVGNPGHPAAHGASAAIAPPQPSKSPEVPASTYSQTMKTYAPAPAANGTAGAWVLNREGSSSSTVDSLLPRWSDQVSSTAVSPLHSPDRYQRYNSPLKTHPSPESKMRLQAAAARHQAQMHAQATPRQEPPVDQPPPLLQHPPPARSQLQVKPVKAGYQQANQPGYPQAQPLMKSGLGMTSAQRAAPGVLDAPLVGGGLEQPAEHKPRKFLPEVKLPSFIPSQQYKTAPAVGAKAAAPSGVTWGVGTGVGMGIHMPMLAPDNAYKTAPSQHVPAMVNHGAAPWQPPPMQYDGMPGPQQYGAGMFMPHGLNQGPVDAGHAMVKPIPHKPGAVGAKHPKSGRLRMGVKQATGAPGGVTGVASHPQPGVNFYPQDAAYNQSLLPPLYSQQPFQGMPGYAPQHQQMYGVPAARGGVPVHMNAAAPQSTYTTQQPGYGDPWGYPTPHMPAAAPYPAMGIFGMGGAQGGMVGRDPLVSTNQAGQG